MQVDERIEAEARPMARRALGVLAVGGVGLTLLVGLGVCVAWGLEGYYQGQERAAREQLAERELGLGESTLRPLPERNGFAALQPAFAILEAIDEDDRMVLYDGDAIHGPDDLAATFHADLEREQQAALLEQVLVQAEPAVAAIDAALAADAIMLPIDWEAGLEGHDYSPLISLKELVWLLDARAWQAAGDGDVERAWREVERGLTLCERLEEPVMIGRLVRSAMTGLLADTVEDLLRSHPLPTAATRARVAAQLARLEDLPPLQVTLRTELALGLNMLHDPAALASGLSGLGVDGATLRWTPETVRRLWCARERAAYAERMRLVIEATHAPREQIQARLEALPPADPSDGELAASLDRIWIRMHGKDLETVARLRLTRTLLDLVQVVEAEGSLPATPTPALADPCRPSQPLRYQRLSPTHARLWSVGRDGKDDGGVGPGDRDTWDLVAELQLPPRP